MTRRSPRRTGRRPTATADRGRRVRVTSGALSGLVVTAIILVLFAIGMATVILRAGGASPTPAPSVSPSPSVAASLLLVPMLRG
jgi:hypothetical protein